MTVPRSPLAVHTAHISYPGPDRLDVSRGVFAPWAGSHVVLASDDVYVQEMRTLYRRDRGQFDALLEAPRVVLVCHCRRPDLCHRTVLARILTRLGARYYGEITEWDATVEEPLFARTA
jgi:hypothetical protein